MEKNKSIEKEFFDDVYPLTPKNYTRYSARGIVINNLNQVAVLHIQGQDAFGWRDHYELPGGGIEEGETSLMAFQREMKEEIGVVTQRETLLFTIRYAYNPLKRYEVSDYYVARVKTYCKTNYTPAEAALFEKIMWIDINTLVAILSNSPVENVGILIHKREKWVLEKFIATF